MGAALSLFVLLSLSVFVVRLAAVTLRLTGLAESTARFQALSAFSGTGFTTSEAESIVNYPIRRRVISLLMVIGNMGFVTVLATLVASFVRTDGEMSAVAVQVTWLLVGMALLWFLMLNKTADRIICSWIGRFLKRKTFLGQRSFHRLLQIADGYSICEHTVDLTWINGSGDLTELNLEDFPLTILGVRSSNGELLINNTEAVKAGDVLVLFGTDVAHEVLAKRTQVS